MIQRVQDSLLDFRVIILLAFVLQFILPGETFVRSFVRQSIQLANALAAQFLRTASFAATDAKASGQHFTGSFM
jgi:hypothetical protein